MTKIFEALEYADLERGHARETTEISIPPLQGADHSPALYAETRPGISDAKRGDPTTSLYQSLVTLLPGRRSRIVQFQGTQKGEGTSTMVRKLAGFASMKLKKNVLLLDLNQKAPNQCSFFQVQSELPRLGTKSQTKLTRKDFARVDGTTLYVTQVSSQGLPAGIICEMSRIDPLLNRLKEEFDLVLIDSPAAISRPECLLLSPKVDGVVLVVQAQKTRWQTVEKVKDRILAQDGNILGVVLNKRRYPIPEFIYERI
ncbi:MAG: hypothetical protein KKG47_11475 [Proteobacteria bacterium]|nr:hypothetical protein [Pseudomonadota bacterium]MBU1739435.1 hypothetical protein [Pseudomonadota bacterium]